MLHLKVLDTFCVLVAIPTKIEHGKFGDLDFRHQSLSKSFPDGEAAMDCHGSFCQALHGKSPNSRVEGLATPEGLLYTVVQGWLSKHRSSTAALGTACPLRQPLVFIA